MTGPGPTACGARLGPERIDRRPAIPIDARDALSRRQESVLGDLVTDAARAGTGSDVALINAGAMRLDDVIPPGPITNYQVESIFLFADDTRMVTFPLTGARLREVLEHGVVRCLPGQGRLPAGLGHHLHLRPRKAIGIAGSWATSHRGAAATLPQATPSRGDVRLSRLPWR